MKKVQKYSFVALSETQDKALVFAKKRCSLFKEL